MGRSSLHDLDFIGIDNPIATEILRLRHTIGAEIHFVSEAISHDAAHENVLADELEARGFGIEFIRNRSGFSAPRA